MKIADKKPPKAFIPKELKRSTKINIITEIDQITKLVEIGYNKSALVALKALRAELITPQNPAKVVKNNKDQKTCEECVM